MAARRKRPPPQGPSKGLRLPKGWTKIKRKAGCCGQGTTNPTVLSPTVRISQMARRLSIRVQASHHCGLKNYSILIRLFGRQDPKPPFILEQYTFRSLEQSFDCSQTGGSPTAINRGLYFAPARDPPVPVPGGGRPEYFGRLPVPALVGLTVDVMFTVTNCCGKTVQKTTMRTVSELA